MFQLSFQKLYNIFRVTFLIENYVLLFRKRFHIVCMFEYCEVVLLMFMIKILFRKSTKPRYMF